MSPVLVPVVLEVTVADVMAGSGGYSVVSSVWTLIRCSTGTDCDFEVSVVVCMASVFRVDCAMSAYVAHDVSLEASEDSGAFVADGASPDSGALLT